MESRIYRRRTQGQLFEYTGEAYTGCQRGPVLSKGYGFRLNDRRQQADLVQVRC